MAVTRANAEAVLINRLAVLMNEASLDSTTVDGTNADLNDALCTALRDMGGTVTDITNIADADLAVLAEADYNQFLDRAELRTLETVEGNMAFTDITAGPRSEKLSQLVASVATRKNQLLKKIQDTYGVATLTTSYILHTFAEHETD